MNIGDRRFLGDALPIRFFGVGILTVDLGMLGVWFVLLFLEN